MTTIYQPIDCDLHDFFEIAAMRHLNKHLTYRCDTGAVITEELKCLNLFSHGGEEFLLVANIRGLQQEIRLDHVLAGIH